MQATLLHSWLPLPYMIIKRPARALIEDVGVRLELWKDTASKAVWDSVRNYGRVAWRKTLKKTSSAASILNMNYLWKVVAADSLAQH